MQIVRADAFKPLAPAGPDFVGSRRRVAPLASQHQPDMSKLLKRLDRCSRIYRFGQPANDACVEAHTKRALSTAAFIAGAFVDDVLVGIVEVFDTGRDGIAEVAFAVDADWRRLGFGSALLESATQWARRSGVRMLRMIISRNNWPMRRLANKAGARFDLALDEIQADIAISA